MTENLKQNRNYGYEALINTFEPALREFIINDIFIPNFGVTWRAHIPKGVFSEIGQIKDLDLLDGLDVEEFFEELNFLNLKSILLFSNNYSNARPFIGGISKDKFAEYMDELNILRRKIAHAKSTFSDIDLENLLSSITYLSQGEKAKDIRRYIENEGYKTGSGIPLIFNEEYPCQHNLPPEHYALEGGFVGREKEIKDIIKLLSSNEDRILTIIGSGGVGKTALALRVAHYFLNDPINPYDAIIWFSAKETRLTEDGIISLESEIKNHECLIKDILAIIDAETLSTLNKSGATIEMYRNYLYSIFKAQRCLLVIDNLETIIKNDEIIDFIKYVPRPSQVLVTSRKGLGELEKRYPVVDLLEKDAIKLFRIIARDKNRADLLKLSNESISDLVKKVRCYPLLIKWSIGQVCLGKEINSAFKEIFAGDSEIAQFTFNDVFSLLSDPSKTVLYSMIIYGEEAVSGYVLMHLANLSDDEFEDASKELIITSFIYSENRELDSTVQTLYCMLDLTRGFVGTKLDENEVLKSTLFTRKHHLSEQIRDLERSQTSYRQSLFSLGIKTTEEKIAFNYVKTAKNYIFSSNLDEAEENFKSAFKIAPSSSYVLTEYSKFEYNRGHVLRAFELAKSAVETNPENYHVWFNYGIMLSKNDQLDEAIQAFEKSKGLNPTYLPIYNELGKVYSKLGLFERAEEEFDKSLIEEKYPNYRHKVLALQSSAQNYRNWAKSFNQRRDYSGQLEKIKQASDTIFRAINISPEDTKLWKIYRQIFLDWGVALCTTQGVAEGRPYLEKCLQPFSLGEDKVTINPDKYTLCEACYYLAFFSLREDVQDHNEIKCWLDVGLKNAQPSSKVYPKLRRLYEQLSRSRGTVRLFNSDRKFGIIESKGFNSIFFKNGFRSWVSDDTLRKIDGKQVSYIAEENPKESELMVAVDIVILDAPSDET